MEKGIIVKTYAANALKCNSCGDLVEFCDCCCKEFDEGDTIYEGFDGMKDHLCKKCQGE